MISIFSTNWSNKL